MGGGSANAVLAIKNAAQPAAINLPVFPKNEAMGHLLLCYCETFKTQTIVIRTNSTG